VGKVRIARRVSVGLFDRDAKKRKEEEEERRKKKKKKKKKKKEKKEEMQNERHQKDSEDQRLGVGVGDSKKAGKHGEQRSSRGVGSLRGQANGVGSTSVKLLRRGNVGLEDLFAPA
jgi:hypothetical protein